MLTAKFVTVTKELVEGLLEKNVHNRKLKPHSVDWMANQIRAGNWHPNNQGIALSRDGVLLDGQHRLMALREAGYPPVQVLLVSGLAPDAVGTIDIGTRRDHADTLRLLMKEDVSSQVVSALAVLANYRFNGSRWVRAKQADRCSSLDLVPYLQAYEDAVVEMSSWFRWRSVRAETRAAFIVYYTYDHLNAIRFIEQVTTGERIDRSMPAYQVREQCVLRKVNGHQGGEDLDVCVRAINDEIGGRPMRMWKSGMQQDWCQQIKEAMPRVDTR